MNSPSTALSHSLSPPLPLDHFRTTDAGSTYGSREDVTKWPWCQACRPYIQLLLAQLPHTSSSSFTAHAASPPTCAISSPFPDYISVPALVHRSQLALFTTTTTTTTTTTSPASPSPNPDQAPPVAASVGTGPSPTQRKTRGVKIACTNCRMANKRCDEGRPCTRCLKSGLGDKCISAERKQRRRTVRQTATAITVSATQVQVDTPLTSEHAAVHVEAGGTPYVDDSHDMADGANYSSPSGSPIMVDFDAPFRHPAPAAEILNNSDPQPSASASASQSQSQLPAHSSPNYAVLANLWQPPIVSFHPTVSEAQYPHSTWGYGVNVGFTHQPPPPPPPPQQQHTSCPSPAPLGSVQFTYTPAQYSYYSHSGEPPLGLGGTAHPPSG